jgi:hypothetical protein
MSILTLRLSSPQQAQPAQAAPSLTLRRRRFNKEYLCSLHRTRQCEPQSPVLNQQDSSAALRKAYRTLEFVRDLKSKDSQVASQR